MEEKGDQTRESFQHTKKLAKGKAESGVANEKYIITAGQKDR